MRHFIKYVLVTGVLLFGFHTASKFKVASPPQASSTQQAAADVAESDSAALSSHPDAQPTDRDSDWRAPVAALSDTRRSEEEAVRAESQDMFKRSTLQRQPTIEKPSSADPFRSDNDWSSAESPRWEKGSSDRKSDDPKPDMPEKTNTRKRTSAAKDSRNGKKTQDLPRRHPGGKAGNDKRKNRPAEWARDDSGTGSEDASPRMTDADSDTPKWPIGERLASSSKTTFAEQLQEEDGWAWDDSPDTASRETSPFEHNRAERSENPSRWYNDVDQPVRDQGGTRQPAKPVRPTQDGQRLRTADRTERHRIVDGDTLPKLAVAYLGDRDRYLDIFQANRDVLSDPRLLPIGAEITIPTSRKSKSSQSARPSADPSDETVWAADDGELVPIPTFALPPRISR